MLCFDCFARFAGLAWSPTTKAWPECARSAVREHLWTTSTTTTATDSTTATTATTATIATITTVWGPRAGIINNFDAGDGSGTIHIINTNKPNTNNHTNTSTDATLINNTTNNDNTNDTKLNNSNINTNTRTRINTSTNTCTGTTTNIANHSEPPVKTKAQTA